MEGNCGKAGGCVQQQRPCLLQLLKENWLKIEVELKSDKHILEMMKDTKQKFDKAEKNKKLSTEKKDEVVRLLKRTTFNWKQKALQDLSLRADWKQEKINFLEDYIGMSQHQLLDSLDSLTFQVSLVLKQALSGTSLTRFWS